MKLINKFTLWFLCITLCTTIIGTAITYYNISSRIDNAATGRLSTVNKLTAEKIQSGTLTDTVVQGRKVAVQEINGPLPEKTFTLTSVNTLDPLSKKPELTITANSYYQINNKNYKITSYACVSKADQILSGLEISILWKWALIIFLIAISARLVSRWVLLPFEDTIKAIGNFNVKKQEPIRLSPTNTKEFIQLNKFVESMTNRAIEEYAALKEFTENASHELQTPVAIMRGKLDLLGESELTDKQAMLISDVQNSLNKLSRINSSLILLARMENNEYTATEPLPFRHLLTETLKDYDELITMKSLSLTTGINSDIHIQLHKDLGNLLVNNLVSNAIRHNVPNGSIRVTLTDHSLTVANTGPEPELPTEELFHRFKKGNQCSSSIGIGLAIVKQICDIHNFPISYTYQKGTHILHICFSETCAHIGSVSVLLSTQEAEESVP